MNRFVLWCYCWTPHVGVLGLALIRQIIAAIIRRYRRSRWSAEYGRDWDQETW